MRSSTRLCSFALRRWMAVTCLVLCSFDWPAIGQSTGPVTLMVRVSPVDSYSAAPLIKSNFRVWSGQQRVSPKAIDVKTQSTVFNNGLETCALFDATASAGVMSVTEVQVAARSLLRRGWRVSFLQSGGQTPYVGSEKELSAALATPNVSMATTQAQALEGLGRCPGRHVIFTAKPTSAQAYRNWIRGADQLEAIVYFVDPGYGHNSNVRTGTGPPGKPPDTSVWVGSGGDVPYSYVDHPEARVFPVREHSLKEAAEDAQLDGQQYYWLEVRALDRSLPIRISVRALSIGGVHQRVRIEAQAFVSSGAVVPELAIVP